MQRGVFRARHHPKIGRVIVSLVPIDVVNDLVRTQRSSELLFSHDSMRVPSVGLFVGQTFAAAKTALA